MEPELTKEAKPQKQNNNEITAYQMSYFTGMDSNAEKLEKMNDFKKRLSQFNDIKNVDEAKKLLNSIMPVTMERTVFFVGDAKCTIINKENLLKISYKSATDYIIFNFVK